MVDYFKDQACKVNTRLERGGQNPVERTKDAIRRQLSVRRCMLRRDLQRRMSQNADIYNQAIKEMSIPEITIYTDINNKEYLTLDMNTDHRQTDGEGQ